MISLDTHPVPAQLWFAADPPRGGEATNGGHRDPDLEARSLRVMIVEDEFFIALDVQNLVQALGHVVVGVAVSADEAVRLAQREQPDVALVDIRLVGPRDGVDAAEEIFSRFGVPSLFVTANTDPQTRRRAQAIHPLGFVEKPVTPQRLQVALRGVSAP
jgi:DNA-binding NarL/FixJ family response regulator